MDSDTVDHVRKRLSETVGTVIFTKKDGTERVMLCTTAPSLVPKKAFGNSKDWNYPDTPPESARAKNPDIAIVWDLQTDAWRSFRWDSFISFSPKETP